MYIINIYINNKSIWVLLLEYIIKFLLSPGTQRLDLMYISFNKSKGHKVLFIFILLIEYILNKYPFKLKVNF